VNPDRKMTEDQERLSQRGLSFVEDVDMVDQPPKLLGHSSSEIVPETSNDKKNGQLLIEEEKQDDDDKL